MLAAGNVMRDVLFLNDRFNDPYSALTGPTAWCGCDGEMRAWLRTCGGEMTQVVVVGGRKGGR